MRVARTEYNISWQIAILPFFITRAWSYIMCTKILRKVQSTAYKMAIAKNIQYNTPGKLEDYYYISPFQVRQKYFFFRNRNTSFLETESLHTQ